MQQLAAIGNALTAHFYYPYLPRYTVAISFALFEQKLENLYKGGRWTKSLVSSFSIISAFSAFCFRASVFSVLSVVLVFLYLLGNIQLLVQTTTLE